MEWNEWVSCHLCIYWWICTCPTNIWVEKVTGLVGCCIKMHSKKQNQQEVCLSRKIRKWLCNEAQEHEIHHQTQHQQQISQPFKSEYETFHVHTKYLVTVTTKYSLTHKLPEANEIKFLEGQRERFLFKTLFSPLFQCSFKWWEFRFNYHLFSLFPAIK